jgi:hypothetical protein
MKSSLLLSAALALLLPAAMPAHAQTQSGGVDSGPANTRAARRAADAKAHAATKQEPLYPQATRTFPEQQASKTLVKPLSALFDLQEKDGQEDEIIAKADAILANSSASPFDKSSAAYMAASAWERKGDASANAQALKYYQLAIDNNGLHNNGHYTAMLHVAQLNAADEHFDQALAAVDKFIAETKSEDPNVWSMKVSYLQNMDRPKEAIDAMQKLLAAAYQQAGDDAKAGQMFDKMRAAGMLTESKDYEAGYHLLFNIEGRQKDALALIDEGLKKGILQPSYDMYVITGRAATEADDTAAAIAAYSKGAPMGKDGTMFLNLAQLQIQEKQYAQAKAATQGAKDKGVPPKLMGLYWRSVAQAENGLGNAAATKAALTEAAKYPEYKKWAEAGLRQGLAK